MKLSVYHAITKHAYAHTQKCIYQIPKHLSPNTDNNLLKKSVCKSLSLLKEISPTVNKLISQIRCYMDRPKTITIILCSLTHSEYRYHDRNIDILYNTYSGHRQGPNMQSIRSASNNFQLCKSEIHRTQRYIK